MVFESLFRLVFDVEHRHRHLVEYPTPTDPDDADNVDASVAAAATATAAVGTIAAWEPIVTLLVIVLMFGVLVLDIVGTDSVMLTALAFFYLSGIINTEEALRGFNSQGLLTVLVLFVVAEGLNKTGALNWYVGKLFGTPKSISGAQMRVMFPITLLSGFINDTPLVMVTMPIVIQWARKMNVPLRFVLSPLSFAALLGGVSNHNFVCN